MSKGCLFQKQSLLQCHRIRTLLRKHVARPSRSRFQQSQHSGLVPNTLQGNDPMRTLLRSKRSSWLPLCCTPSTGRMRRGNLGKIPSNGRLGAFCLRPASRSRSRIGCHQRSVHLCLSENNMQGSAHVVFILLLRMTFKSCKG